MWSIFCLLNRTCNPRKARIVDANPSSEHVEKIDRSRTYGRWSSWSVFLRKGEQNIRDSHEGGMLDIAGKERRMRKKIKYSVGYQKG